MLSKGEKKCPRRLQIIAEHLLLPLEIYEQIFSDLENSWIK